MRPMVLAGVILLIGAAAIIISCQNPSVKEVDNATEHPVTIREANPRMAEFLKENLIEAQRLYSVRTGGGGMKNFADNPKKLSGLASATVLSATCDGTDQLIPADGYIVRMLEYPAGDAFRTGYKLVIEAAPGFKGQTFTVTKQYGKDKMEGTKK